MSDILYIVIPAYNESANIRQVVDDWYPVVQAHDGGGASRLVVVNDGSTDDTYAVLCGLAQTHPLLVPLTKPNGGHGSTIVYGYRYALEHQADYVFQTDSDGQTLAEEFAPFWALRERCDMAIGLRGNRQDGAARILVTRVLRLVIRLCFDESIPDANTPYRLMRADALREDIGLIPKDFFLSNVLISVIFARKGRSVKYLPITFRPRQGGVNSINLRRIFRVGRQAVVDFRRLNRELKGIANK